MRTHTLFKVAVLTGLLVMRRAINAAHQRDK